MERLGETKDFSSVFHQALKSSKVVKVKNGSNHIKRRIPFKVDQKMIDHMLDCSIVVSNLPEGVTIEQMMKLFNSFGVRKVTFKKADEERSAQSHAVVELSSEKAVADAVQKFSEGKPTSFDMAYGETVEPVLSVVSKRSVMKEKQEAKA